MKNHKVQILLIMGISFWFLLFPVYTHFYSLDEADFLSTSQAWESPDQDGLLAGIVKKGKTLDWHFFPMVLLLFAFFYEPPGHFARPNSPLSQKVSILRC